MQRAASSSVALAAFAIMVACDVTSTVGYNDGQASNAGRGGGGAALACGTQAELTQCSEGTSACLVRDLFTGIPGALSFGVDDDFYYFMSADAVLSRRPKSGGETVPLATTNQLIYFTVDATHVYWTEYSARVARVAKAGGPTETVMEPFGHPTELGTDTDYVYCVLPEEGEVAMSRKSGGPETKAIGQARPTGIAVDASHVYWVNRGTAANTGQLVRAPHGDLAQLQVVATNLDAPLQVAIDGDDAIVVEEAGNVRRVPKTGGAISLLASGLVEPKAVRAFRGRVYLSGMSGLLAVPTAGGAGPTLLDKRPITALTLGCDGVHALSWFEGEAIRYGK